MKLVEKLNLVVNDEISNLKHWCWFVDTYRINWEQPGNTPLHNLLDILNKLDLTTWM